MIYRIILLLSSVFLLISCDLCENKEYHFSGDWIYIGQVHRKNKGDTIIFSRYYPEKDTFPRYVSRSIWEFKNDHILYDIFESGGSGLKFPSKYCVTKGNILKTGKVKYQIISKNDSIITLVKKTNTSVE